MRPELIALGAIIFAVWCVVAIAAIDLSGTSPTVAKGFASQNNISEFDKWQLPDYGHYDSEVWPDVDDSGRPYSLVAYMLADTDLLPSVLPDTNTSNGTSYNINSTSGTLEYL